MKKSHHLRWILGGIGFGILALVTILFWAYINSILAYGLVKKGAFNLAGQRARQAEPGVQLLHTLSFHQISEIEFWLTGLELVQSLPEHQIVALATIKSLTTVQEIDSDSPVPLSQLTERLKSDHTLLSTLHLSCQNSWLIQQLKPHTCDQITTANQLVSDATQWLDWLGTGPRKLIVLFQNTDELRATGGFMGSYAQISLKNGQLTDLNIEDIYEPDGQFTGFVAAPTGVSEYLSSGNGLRLPDANWHPDFAVSSRTILSYFAFGDRAGLDGTIAITSDLVEDLLRITGPVALADYDTTITADNFSQLARADRKNFFPGSKQKPHFLSGLWTQLQFRFESFSAEQWQQTAELVLKAFQNKTIQLYTNDPDLEQSLQHYGLAGVINPQLICQSLTEDFQIPLSLSLTRLDLMPLGHLNTDCNSSTTPPEPDLLLYPVESNVGINKANKAVTREISVNLDEYRSQITFIFHNQNPVTDAVIEQTQESADQVHYVDYQRFITSPEVTLHSLTINGQPLTTWDEQTIENSSGQIFKQFGFLVTVPEQTNTTVSLELTYPKLGSRQNHEQGPVVLIQKQPGILSIPYTLSYQDQTSQFLLEKDTGIILP